METEQDMEYVDVTNCPHEAVTWTEEKINGNDNALYIGYQCEFCKQWVDGEDEEDDAI